MHAQRQAGEQQLVGGYFPVEPCYSLMYHFVALLDEGSRAVICTRSSITSQSSLVFLALICKPRVDQDRRRIKSKPIPEIIYLSPLQAHRSLSRKLSVLQDRECHNPCWTNISKCFHQLTVVGISYLSNQFPSTPLAERSPPTCTPSDRHRSSPWKIEKVVHRIWPSGVCRTVPRSISVSAFFYEFVVSSTSYSPRILLLALGSQEA